MTVTIKRFRGKSDRAGLLEIADMTGIHVSSLLEMPGENLVFMCSDEIPEKSEMLHEAGLGSLMRVRPKELVVKPGDFLVKLQEGTFRSMNLPKLIKFLSESA